jgi:hypothetical protein
MLERDYKFYLSFENSICPDYVTEKFYNPLLFSTVPIVYGGADYDAVGAPQNSYIDVRSFKSGIFAQITIVELLLKVFIFYNDDDKLCI